MPALRHRCSLCQHRAGRRIVTETIRRGDRHADQKKIVKAAIPRQHKKFCPCACHQVPS